MLRAQALAGGPRGFDLGGRVRVGTTPARVRRSRVCSRGAAVQEDALNSMGCVERRSPDQPAMRPAHPRDQRTHATSAPTRPAHPRYQRTHATSACVLWGIRRGERVHPWHAIWSNCRAGLQPQGQPLQTLCLWPRCRFGQALHTPREIYASLSRETVTSDPIACDPGKRTPVRFSWRARTATGRGGQGGR